MMRFLDPLIRLLSKVLSFKTKPKIGLSCDDSVKLSNLPMTCLMQKGKFIRFNKELINFEVISVNKEKRKLIVGEICTGNEFEISFEFFEYLFEEAPVPKECKL